MERRRSEAARRRKRRMIRRRRRWRGRTTHSDFRIFSFSRSESKRDSTEDSFCFQTPSGPSECILRPRLFGIRNAGVRAHFLPPLPPSRVRMSASRSRIHSFGAATEPTRSALFFHSILLVIFRDEEAQSGARGIFNGQNGRRRDVAPGATNPHVRRSPLVAGVSFFSPRARLLSSFAEAIDRPESIMHSALRALAHSFDLGLPSAGVSARNPTTLDCYTFFLAENHVPIDYLFKSEAASEALPNERAAGRQPEERTSARDCLIELNTADESPTGNVIEEERRSLPMPGV